MKAHLLLDAHIVTPEGKLVRFPVQTFTVVYVGTRQLQHRFKQLTTMLRQARLSLPDDSKLVEGPVARLNSLIFYLTAPTASFLELEKKKLVNDKEMYKEATDLRRIVMYTAPEGCRLEYVQVVNLQCFP